MPFAFICYKPSLMAVTNQ